MERIICKLNIITVTPRISRFDRVRSLGHNSFRGPTCMGFYDLIVLSMKGRIYFVLR